MRKKEEQRDVLDFSGVRVKNAFRPFVNTNLETSKGMIEGKEKG
jgi:hypothetical protein